MIAQACSASAPTTASRLGATAGMDDSTHLTVGRFALISGAWLAGLVLLHENPGRLGAAPAWSNISSSKGVITSIHGTRSPVEEYPGQGDRRK